MPVPNTNTFTLQDVVDEVSPTTDTLDECFTAAVAGLFDPLYEGSKDSLSNFRNYGALTAVSVTSKGQTTAANACASLGFVTRYISGGNATPTAGEILYADSGGAIVIDGGGQFFSIGNESFVVSSTGVISLVATCPSTTTTTTTTCLTLTSYSSTGAESTSSAACAAANSFTRYHDGSGATPVNGDIVYSDACGNNVFVGFSNWYSDSAGVLAYQINNSGVVSNIQFC